MKKMQLIAIGGSAGGLEPVQKILTDLEPQDHLAVVITIHFPPRSKNLLPEILQDLCSFKIKEAESGETIRGRHVYIAPPDYHLSVERNHTLSLSTEAPVLYSRPAIDIMFSSAAEAFESNCIGILLSGASSDGALGLKKIKECNGFTIVQDPDEAQFKKMPLSAVELLHPDRILSTEQISPILRKLTQESK